MKPLCTYRLLTYTKDDVTFVRLDGDHIHLDEMAAIRLRENLQALVETGRYRLALDMGNIDFLTSTMVETLLSLHRQVNSVGGHLSVSNLTPIVAEVFAVLQLACVLDVRPVCR